MKRKELFDDSRCDFYIAYTWGLPTDDVVFEASGRSNPKNPLAQRKDWRAVVDGSGEQPVEQLGVHGHGFVVNHLKFHIPLPSRHAPA